MFQAVINQAGWSAGRFGAGMWVSLAVHAAAIGAVAGLSAREVKAPEKEIEVVYRPPMPPKGNPNPPKPVAQTQAPKPKPPKKELVQPKKALPLPAEPPKPVEEPPEAPPEDNAEPVDPSLPYIPGSDPNGVDIGGVANALLPPGLTGNGGGTGEEVLPFGTGMTPPQLLAEGVPLRYTQEALHARVSGTLIARCTVTREGRVEDCRIIKGLPFMDAAVLEGLTSRQYRPVTFQGRAVSVKYTFNVSLRLP